MSLLILEALSALVLLVFIVWWTMFHGRHHGERSAPVRSAPLTPAVPEPDAAEPTAESASGRQAESGEVSEHAMK